MTSGGLWRRGESRLTASETGTSEWRVLTLNQLGQIVTGKTPPTRNTSYFGGDIPFVTPSDFDGRRKIGSTKRYLTVGGADAVAGANVPGGTVMVSCIGSDMGKSALTLQPSVTNQQINSIIVDDPDIDSLFVYYSLSNRRDEIRAAGAGSAVPIMNKSEFGNLQIALPPLPEQRAIAHILGTLDDKIELNRRMNQTLEEMARAIFKDWFIDFGPTRAKMEGREAVSTRRGVGPFSRQSRGLGTWGYPGGLGGKEHRGNHRTSCDGALWFLDQSLYFRR